MGLYGLDQFFGVRAAASNVGHSRGAYTAEMFQTDFPQFYKATVYDEVYTEYAPFVPPTILTQIIAQANTAIQPDKWLDGWRYACGLYVAHYATMYLMTNSGQGPESAAQLAAQGSTSGMVKRATLGDSTVEYDTGATSAALADWGSFNATTYGQQLATQARIVGMGGIGVI